MSLYGLSLRTPRLPLAFVGLMLLTSCGLSPLSLLTGGGPNIAANTQVGAENNQGITITREAPKLELGRDAKVDTVDQSTTNNTTIDPLILVLLILGWLLPSPNEIGSIVRGWFTNRR